MEARAETQGAGSFESLENGVHYLRDYYAILGVENEADLESINAAFRKKIVQYHPDRFQGLAPEIASQAEYMSRVLSEAHDTLEDSDKRLAYDQTLATWEGPISKSGVPVVDISRPYFGVEMLLGDNTDHEIESIVAKANAMTGFNPVIFDFLKTQYESMTDPPAELVQAYQQALAQRDIALSIEDAFRREALGMKSVDNRNPSIKYLETTQKEIEERREQVIVEVDNSLLRLASGEIRLLGEASSDIQRSLESDPAAAISLLRIKALDQFDRRSQAILALAEEKQVLIDRRLELYQGQYIPEQPELFDHLIVCIKVEEARRWFPFVLEDTSVVMDLSVSDEEMKELEDEESARAMIDRGYNIMFLELEEGLPANGILDAGVSKHFQTILDKREQA